MLHFCCPSRSSQQSWWQRDRPPCCLLWPGEQYGDCEWLIPLDRWQVGPLSNQGTHFSTGLGRPSDRGGKTWAAFAAAEPFAQSRDWEVIVKGKYYLHCRAADVFVMSEDELGENTPPEGDWKGDRNGPDCVNAAQNYMRGLFSTWIFFIS